ncbi:hypothetical protein sphantq_04767 (plasmid) [Sphingobium sp. AntQ-1]|uniref:DUF6880 family protein n=1 Tax=Sphingobium sp. AntQ-1 TaxID=2930091 RepID=UPI00234EB0E5|nr:DUF6880 family protein [Sphingobium sp. AntQ-1]WCP16271.1 hypothetical protein sphantq_04767 [Sphingobium sp. AntQ-1]
MANPLDDPATTAKYPAMPSPKTLNLANLEALGAARLAALLLELAQGDALAKRRLRMELASASGGGEDVAQQVHKRLVAIGKAKAFVDWHKIKPLAHDIDMQRRAIVDHVAPTDPARAFELMARLIALARPVYERCDDSNGAIAAIFDSALADLAPLATTARLPVGTLVDRVFEGVCDNGYGQHDGLIALMAPALGDAGLGQLKARFEALGKTPPVRPPDKERRVIGYGSGGPMYADELDARSHARTVHSALTDIADALGDVDSFIAQHPADARRNPAIAAEIAERLLAAGRGDEAMLAIEAAAATRHKGGYWPDWDRVRIAVLEALGRNEAAQDGRWDLFAAALDENYLRAYLKRLPDFDDIEAEARAMAHVRAFPSFHHALHFLVAWPNVEAAAAMVLARAAEIDGNHYEVLTPAADALEQRHPLAATLLLRAMIDFALEKARHKRYPHAARHLLSCESLARRIDDFGAHPDHSSYLATLKTHHGRKSGFWQA